MTRQELLDYVKVLFELEHQIYTYGELKRSYEKKIEELDNMKINTVKMKYNDDRTKLYYSYLPNTGAGYCSKELENCDMTIACGELDKKIIKNAEWYHTKECKDYINSRVKQPSKATNFVSNLLSVVLIIVIILAFKKWASVFQLGTDESTLYFFIGNAAIFLFIYIRYAYYSKYNLRDYEFAKLESLNQFYSMKFEEYYKMNYEAFYQNKRQEKEKELNEIIIPHIEEAKRLRDYLYSKNIIFPKYRNLIAMAQIYEYLLSGRCSSLEGPHGAYNLFESELRLNVIIDKLDIIINKLNSLGASMSVLCGAINTTNSLLNNINSSINAYNAQCATYNANVAKQYHI